MQANPPSTEQLLASLEEAARALLFPSESDHPLIPFRWDGEAPSPAALRVASGLAEEEPVEVTTAEEFFAPVLEPSPEAEGSGSTDAARYRALVDLLERYLADVRVYRVGRVDIDVYVVGRHPSGAWLGLRTKVVET